LTRSFSGEDEFDAAEIDRELIAGRLKQDVMEHKGKVHLFIADLVRCLYACAVPWLIPRSQLDFQNTPGAILKLKGHRGPVTAAVVSTSGDYVFSSGKEGSIVKWSLSSGKKIAVFQKVRENNTKGKGKAKSQLESAAGDVHGHSDEILALALSDDDKYLVSGGRDRRVGVWDPHKGVWIKGFYGQLGHRDAISVRFQYSVWPTLKQRT
jgi:ribosomal RNA-processing protein 9